MHFLVTFTFKKLRTLVYRVLDILINTLPVGHFEKKFLALFDRNVDKMYIEQEIAAARDETWPTNNVTT